MSSVASSLVSSRLRRTVIRLSSILLLALSPLQSAQKEQLSSSKEIPVDDLVLYEMGFRRIQSMERFADRLDAQAGKGWWMRAQHKTQAQLSDAEGIAVKRIAKQCLSRLDSIDKSRDELVKLGTAELLVTQKRVPSQDARIRELSMERMQVVVDAIHEIRVALGDHRAADYDRYLRAEVAPTFKIVKQKPAPKE